MSSKYQSDHSLCSSELVEVLLVLVTTSTSRRRKVISAVTSVRGCVDVMERLRLILVAVILSDSLMFFSVTGLVSCDSLLSIFTVG